MSGPPAVRAGHARCTTRLPMVTCSRILKGAAPLAARRIEAAVWDADGRVREMIAQAEAEAGRIVAAAEEARARVAAEAVEAGRAEGRARAAAVLAQAALARDRLLREAEGEVVRLALAVARKVLGRELATPGTVADLAAAAVATARDRREVVLRVSPADAAEVRAREGRLAALTRAPLEIREDLSLERGAAIVDTDAGRIDAGIEAQLDAIARAVEEDAP